MGIGESRLKGQVAGRGLFAHVRLEVTVADPPGRFDSAVKLNSEGSQYVPVVQVAAQYAWERLLTENKHPPHVAVRVLELHTTTADTSVMAVFYASVLAYCDAIGLQLDTPPVIDSAGSAARTVTLPL